MVLSSSLLEECCEVKLEDGACAAGRRGVAELVVLLAVAAARVALETIASCVVLQTSAEKRLLSSRSWTRSSFLSDTDKSGIAEDKKASRRRSTMLCRDVIVSVWRP